MNTITKAHISIFLDDQNEPCGLIYFNKNRERVIYLVDKADEEQIVGLFEGKNCTSKKQEVHMSLLPLEARIPLQIKHASSK